MVDDDMLEIVDDFATAEQRVRTGVDSARLVVLHGQSEEVAKAAAQRGFEQGRGPLPSRPHSIGRRCLVVLPTYNERENLEAISREILAYLETDLLIVDDGSPDRTGVIADQLAGQDSRISVLHREDRQGLGTAYIAGFAHAERAGYQRVFQMDADFSHPPWDLPRLAAASLGSDVVIGSRYVSGGCTAGWSLRRRVLSRGGNLYARSLLGLSIRDVTSGFRCYDVQCLARLDLSRVRAQGYSFQIEITYRMAKAGLGIVEVPIHFVDRREGTSKMNAKIAAEAVVLVPALRLRLRKRDLFRNP
jgi:dolichol-phosphate mannosyltransferase